ncbi:MAG: DsrE family protein [Chloroflexota bacterium]|nr:DsrE family protein [Chloroflexota bacterium]
MATITVAVGDPPYGAERVYTALRFALVAIHDGHHVNLFVFEDAVGALKRGQKPPEMPLPSGDRMPNCEALVRAGMAEGMKVKACGVCSAERALSKDELIEGAEVATMRDLLQWVLESDRAVFF